MADAPLVQFKLMLPSSLKSRVEEAARTSRRSLSQEIVAALEEKYPAPEPTGLDLKTLLGMRENLMEVLNDSFSQRDLSRRNSLQRVLDKIDAQIELRRGDQSSPSKGKVRD